MKTGEMHLISNTLNFRKKLIALLALLTLFYSLFEGASIGLLLPVLQLVAEGDLARLVGQGGYWASLDLVYRTLGLPLNLITLLLSVLLIVLLKECVGYAQRVCSKKVESDYTAHLRSLGFNNVVRSDMAYFNNKKIGDIVNTLTVQTTNAGYMVWALTKLGTTSFLMLAYLFMLLIMSWQLTLLSFAVVLLLSISVQRQIQYSRSYGRSLVELNSQLHHFLSQKLGGIRVVKVATAENQEVRKLGEIVRKIAAINLRQEISAGIIIFIFQVFTAAAVLFIFYFAAQVIRMPLTQLVVFSFVMVRMSPYVINIHSLRHELANYMGAAENVFQTIDEVSAWTKIKSGPRIFEGFKDCIQFKNVSFSYDDTPVLKDINITIKKGEMFAIVGATGAGKSTMADLLLRLHDPASGQIIIDGIDIKEFDLSSLRKRIGFVGQDIFLFNDTIISNIGYGSDSASKEDIVKAAEIAHIHEFINKLPEDYRTVIGERGAKLSGGQKQRLAMARAVVNNPEILILDEATSHLDSESEQLIQQSLNEIRRDCTIVAIAHRLSTVERADKIIVIEEGRIVEEGKHEDLLAIGGHYAGYYNLQFKAGKVEKN